LSFLTNAFATDVFPEADAPAMPITWRVNHGGLYSTLSFITSLAKQTAPWNVRKWPIASEIDYHRVTFQLGTCLTIRDRKALKGIRNIFIK
jgi:hypothetical protein